MFYHLRIKKKLLYGIILLIIILIMVYFINDQIIQYVFQASPSDVIYCIDTAEKTLVFTFEASAGEEYVEEILEILSIHGIRGTFFVTGRWMKENPGLMQKVAAKHEVGSHSYSHPRLEELRDKDLMEEFINFREAALEILGEETEVKYFRPPFGEYDERALSLAMEEGQLVVLWSIESKDWVAPSLDQYIDELMEKVHPGGIVAFRAGSKETVMSLPLLIQSIWKAGYRVVSLETAISENRRGF